jgi:hypothetical protein
MVIGPRVVVAACIRAAMSAMVIVGRRGRRVRRGGAIRGDRRCRRNCGSRMAFPGSGRNCGSRRNRGCSPIGIVTRVVVDPIVPILATILALVFTAIAIGLTIFAPVGPIFLPGRFAGLAGER